MLNKDSWIPADLPEDSPPLLVVVVDTEEEFDWGLPHDRDSTAVETIRSQTRAHRIFERHGIRPTYMVDYAVAAQEAGFAPLRALADAGQCEIGAHLHPWVNPPHDEAVTARNSFPGNLPAELERDKLVRLTETIAENFGQRPIAYKAGRYGVGPATTETLAALGYEIDASVVPRTDLTDIHGPDFRACGARPYWFGPDGRLLEIPLTVGFTGLFAGAGPGLYDPLIRGPARRLRLAGIAARLGLIERITLTPEGVDHSEHRRLTRAMLGRGQRVFSFTYHSPSLAPGHTPYVRDEAELAVFLDRFDRYFDYFLGEIGGRAATLREARDLLAAGTAAPERANS
ncbi:MAG: polysaccharide deacetylase family protein [Alphaproteobacteria bacterium]